MCSVNCAGIQEKGAPASAENESNTFIKQKLKSNIKEWQTLRTSFFFFFIMIQYPVQRQQQLFKKKCIYYIFIPFKKNKFHICLTSSFGLPM